MCLIHADGITASDRLPISYFVFKELVGWQAVAGTILAILGVAILFIV